MSGLFRFYGFTVLSPVLKGPPPRPAATYLKATNALRFENIAAG